MKQEKSDCVSALVSVLVFEGDFLLLKNMQSKTEKKHVAH